VTSDEDRERQVSNRPQPRASVRRTGRASWEVVAILVVVAVILVLAADGVGLISR
jgi:hypothetical protein